MASEEYVILASDSTIGYETMQEIAKFLERRNIKLLFFDPDPWEKCKQLIREEGPSEILSSVKLREDVLGVADKTQQKYQLLIQMVRDKLESLTPASEIVIIDSYVFPQNICNAQDYLDIFRDIFRGTVVAFNQILFITRPAFNQSLFASVKRLLQDMNPRLSVDIKTSDDFHDRLWIVDQKKGFFTGTSLKGIGKRYALCDKIRDPDVAFVVEELKRLGLIQ